MRLAVACTDALGWRVVRERWRACLPTAFETVTFFNPEDFGNPYLKKGFRTLAKGLAMRGAVSAALKSGADRVLVATNGESTMLTDAQARRLVIYGDASGRQLNDLYRFGRPERKLRARDKRLRSLASNGATFLAMSSWCARGFQTDYQLPGTVGVLPPPMDTELFQVSSHAKPLPPRALFVGGDFHRKGGPLILEASDDPRLATAEWDIVTTSAVPDRPRVKVHRGVQPQSSALLDLLRRAHVFVFPTTADCSPLAVLEAMASGIPVITTNVGGLSDMVDASVGHLLGPSPTTDQLVQAIQTLITDPAERERLGANARERVVAQNSLPVHATRLRSLI